MFNRRSCGQSFLQLGAMVREIRCRDNGMALAGAWEDGAVGLEMFLVNYETVRQFQDSCVSNFAD